MISLKEKMHTYYSEVINSKIKSLQLKLDELKEIGSNETKNTAGDKHETALAMLQIEQANTRTQLQQIQLQKEIFNKIKINTNCAIIVNGSLIKTDKGYFYLSIALGKTIIDNKAIIALSPQSPLGEKFKGLRINDIVKMSNNTYLIEDIL